MLNSPQISQRFDKASSQGPLFIQTLSKKYTQDNYKADIGNSFYIGTQDKNLLRR